MEYQVATQIEDRALGWLILRSTTIPTGTPDWQRAILILEDVDLNQYVGLGDAELVTLMRDKLEDGVYQVWYKPIMYTDDDRKRRMDTDMIEWEKEGWWPIPNFEVCIDWWHYQERMAE